MQNKTTADVIAVGRNALNNYENVCEKDLSLSRRMDIKFRSIFWTQPGSHKIKFKALLDQLSEDAPEQALIKMHHFYEKMHTNSHLKACIHHGLVRFLSIKVYAGTDTLHGRPVCSNVQREMEERWY